MKRALLVLPLFFLAACGGTPDVVPVDEGTPEAPAVVDERPVLTNDAMPPSSEAADAVVATEEPAPPAHQPTVVDEPAPDDAMPVDYAKSSIMFVGKSSIVDHPGRFNKFRVVMQQEEGDWLKTKFRFDIDLQNIVTDSEMLDGHLQKEDFFDTANFPVATFESDGGVWPRDDGGFEIDGPLTVKGVTKTVTVSFVAEDKTLRFHLEFPRKEFGVGNDSYGDKLLDEIMPVDGTIVLQ